jgi:hypothetical protein
MLKPRRAMPFAVFSLIVAFTFAPFFETLHGLQLETPMLLLLILSVGWLKRDRQVAAGVAVGFCGMLKVYPAFLLLYFVATRRWRALGASMATAAVLLGISLLVMGVETNRVYFLELLPYMMQELPLVSGENLSLGRYAQTLFGVGPPAAKWLVQLLAIPLVALSVVAVSRNRDRRDHVDTLALGLSVFIAALLLILPNSWANYQLLLLLPWMALVARALATERCDWTLLAPALAAAFLLFFSENTPDVQGFYPLPQPLHDRLVASRILATVLLWIAPVVWLLRRGRRGRAG